MFRKSFIIVFSIIIFSVLISNSCSDKNVNVNKDVKCSDFAREIRMDSRYKKTIDYFAKMEYRYAVSLLDELLVTAKLNDEPYQIILVVHDLSINYLKMNDFTKALEYLNEGKRLNQQLNDSKYKALNLECFAKYHLAKGNLDEALSCYTNAYNIYYPCDQSEKMAICLHEIGLINYKMKKVDAAIDNLNKAAKINAIIKRDLPKSGNFFLLGKILFEQKEYDKAKGFIKEAYIIDKTYKQEFKVGLDLKMLGDINWDEKKKVDAVNYFERAFDLFKVIPRSPEPQNEMNYLIDKNSLEIVTILLKYYKETKCAERVEFFQNEFSPLSQRVEQFEKRQK